MALLLDEYRLIRAHGKVESGTRLIASSSPPPDLSPGGLCPPSNCAVKCAVDPAYGNRPDAKRGTGNPVPPAVSCYLQIPPTISVPT
jgi:hypothetical protein